MGGGHPSASLLIQKRCPYPPRRQLQPLARPQYLGLETEQVPIRQTGAPKTGQVWKRGKEGLARVCVCLGRLEAASGGRAGAGPLVPPCPVDECEPRGAAAAVSGFSRCSRSPHPSPQHPHLSATDSTQAVVSQRPSVRQSSRRPGCVFMYSLATNQWRKRTWLRAPMLR